MLERLMYTVFVIIFAIFIDRNSLKKGYKAGYEKAKSECDIKIVNKTDLEKFYVKTNQELKNSQVLIQNVVDTFGENAGGEIVKEILFKNFCKIPGVVDTMPTKYSIQRIN